MWSRMAARRTCPDWQWLGLWVLHRPYNSSLACESPGVHPFETLPSKLKGLVGWEMFCWSSMKSKRDFCPCMDSARWWKRTLECSFATRTFQNGSSFASIWEMGREHISGKYIAAVSASSQLGEGFQPSCDTGRANLAKIKAGRKECTRDGRHCIWDARVYTAGSSCDAEMPSWEKHIPFQLSRHLPAELPSTWQ